MKSYRLLQYIINSLYNNVFQHIVTIRLQSSHKLHRLQQKGKCTFTAFSNMHHYINHSSNIHLAMTYSIEINATFKFENISFFLL